MKIVFIETLSAKSYTIKDLSGTLGLGGTETSILRISRELAPRHKVIQFQSGRKQRETDANGVEYWPLEDVAKVEDADVLIILRLPRLLKMHKHFPGAKVRYGDTDSVMVEFTNLLKNNISPCHNSRILG